MRESHDTVVIGGGQAGLAMSTVLQRRGDEHVVLERRRVGERWRTERWDSLRFQFPNWSIQLPGYTYRGDDPDRFAHYGETAPHGCRADRGFGSLRSWLVGEELLVVAGGVEQICHLADV
jgi:choline dehydrogenase-like flavoprotein